MKSTPILLATLLLGALAHADENALEAKAKETESITVAVGKLADESRLVPSLMTMARELEAQKGVQKTEVRLSKRDVRVRFDPGAIGLPALVEAIESLGYHASTPAAEPVAEHAPPDRIVVAAR
jgi:hypothetical protein